MRKIEFAMFTKSIALIFLLMMCDKSIQRLLNIRAIDPIFAAEDTLDFPIFITE